MGSDSDLPIMEETASILDEFGVPFNMCVLSAHRTPLDLDEYLKKMREKGVEVFICGAGAAAHLAGAVASRVTVPVIGVPLGGSTMDGIDALYSTVQMPGGIPVATVAIGKAGAKNAALLAIQILGLSDETLANKVIEHRNQQKIIIEEKNRKLKDTHRDRYKCMIILDD